MTIETQETKQLILTTVYRRLQDAWLYGKRRVFIEGGTWSSKTYSALQLLKVILENSKEPLLATVTSESMPHLKGGAIADFKDIMGDEFCDGQFNRTDFIYTFPKSGCRLEFVSADNPGRLTGPRREILFVNEVNNISYESYWQADMRTRLFTICDWNPTSEFWFHNQRLADDSENAYIHTTYLDALEVLPQSKRNEIESWKERDPDRWTIYGLGELGKPKGLVYPLFSQVEQLPDGDIFYGLDFGYSNDPTSLVKCVIRGEELYCEELIYEAGLTNDMIAHRMDGVGVRRNYDEIFADSAEPKSIEEIYRYGFNIKPAPKGPGSVEYGHQKIRQYKQFWTKDSLKCIKEQRNFRYVLDKNGEPTEKTTHTFSHGMDARRYGIMGKFEPQDIEEVIIYNSMETVRDLEL